MKKLIVAAFLGIVNFSSEALEWLTRARKSQLDGDRILLIRTAALGDFILSIPAFERVRKAYPAARITLLTSATTEQKTLRTVEAYSIEPSPWLSLLRPGIIDEVVPFLVTSFGDLWKQRRAILERKAFNRAFIVTEGFGVNPMGNIKKILFLRTLGVRCRIFGIRTRAYPLVFPSVQRGLRGLEHHLLGNLRSVDEDPVVADVSFGISIPYVDPTVEAERWFEGYLRETGIGNAAFVVIAPGSRLEFKRWPEKSYAEVISRLISGTRVHVLLVGSGPEKTTISRMRGELWEGIAGSELFHDLGGNTSLAQLAAVFRRAAVFLGNDGGTCHLAAASGCRVVSVLNGVEFPDAVVPWGSWQYTVRHSVPCSPCFSYSYCPRGDSICVSRITPNDVLMKVEQALNDGAKGRLSDTVIF